MNEQELIASLRSNPARDTARSPFCLDDDVIAAYVDGSLDSREHQRHARHLAECGSCIARVGHLSRLRRDAEATEQPSEALLARARDIVHRRPMRSAPKWLAAAVVALAIIIMPQLGPEPDDAETLVPTTRTVPSVVSAPDLHSPSSGVTIAPDQLEFSWRAVPESLYYNVRIVSHSGLLITEHRVNGTEWQAREGLNLTPGAEYYVRVDAYLSGARSISSDHVRFKIAERQ